jgi:hypothetical protein
VPLLAYPWTMLNKTKPWSITFNTDGTFSSALLRFSLSGVPNSTAVKISLDKQEVQWEANKDVKLDRWFYDLPVYGEEQGGLPQGSHELSFNLQENGLEGLAQLCSVELIEYGNANE